MLNIQYAYWLSIKACVVKLCIYSIHQASDTQKTMEECYLKALEVTKDDPKTNLEDLGLLYEKVARVL